jgi:Glycosyltransferase family 87
VSDRLREGAPVVVGCALLLATCVLFTNIATWKAGRDHDTAYYENYGHSMLAGQVPYRDIPIEYPPAALPMFAMPAVGGATEATFRWRFQWLMALCGAGLIAVAGGTLRTLGVARRERFVLLAAAGLAPLLLGSVAFKRYDLWPALLASGSLLLYLRGRPRLGGALLGLAAAAKLYPAALVPLLVADVWRRRGREEALRSLAAVVAVFLACFVPFLAVAPHGTLRTFSIQVHRPLEIESLGAALLIAAHHLGLLSLSTVRSYGSVNLPPGGAESAGVVATDVVELAALVWVWLACWRRRLSPSGLATGAAAVVTMLVAFGKVFSPQYLLWLMPFVILCDPRVRRPAVALLLASCLLTQAWVQHRFGLLERLGKPESVLVLVRDLLVVGLAVLVARALVASPGSRSEQSV